MWCPRLSRALGLAKALGLARALGLAWALAVVWSGQVGGGDGLRWWSVAVGVGDGVGVAPPMELLTGAPIVGSRVLWSVHKLRSSSGSTTMLLRRPSVSPVPIAR